MVDEVGLVGKEVGGRKVQETVQLWRQMYGRVINDAKEAFYILLLAIIVAVNEVIQINTVTYRRRARMCFDWVRSEARGRIPCLSFRSWPLWFCF